MQLKVTAPLFLSTLALSSSLALAGQAQTYSASQTTTFHCVTSGNNFATIAQRGNRVTPPLIVWKTNEFGRDYTPAQRCQMVSQKLTKAVASNGGRLTNLMLTTGNLNRQPVVCYVNGQARCNSSNVLFTLDRKNAKNPSEVLARLMNFGTNGSGDPVVSIAQPQSGQSSAPQYIRLEDVVDGGLNAGGGNQPVPSNPQGTDRGI